VNLFAISITTVSPGIIFPSENVTTGCSRHPPYSADDTIVSDMVYATVLAVVDKTPVHWPSDPDGFLYFMTALVASVKVPVELSVNVIIKSCPV
jgi:hypothetical protein